MIKDKSKFQKMIKCFYTKRPGFGLNIHGFVYQDIDVRQNRDGTRSIIKFPPVDRRAKVDSDGYFEVCDLKENRDMLKHLVKEGMVRILDEELEYEIVGSTRIENYSEIVSEIKEEKVYVEPEEGKISFNRRKPYGPEEKKKRQEIAAKARQAKLDKQKAKKQQKEPENLSDEIDQDEIKALMDAEGVSSVD